MELAENHRHLILRYLEGDCNVEEENQVEQQLKASPAFKRELRQMDGLLAALQAINKAKQVEKIKALYDGLSQEKGLQGKGMRLYKMIGLAAAAVVLLVVGYLSLFSGNGQKGLYEEFYHAYTHSPEARETNELEKNAYQLYKSAQYAASIPILEKLVEEGKPVDGVYLMLGSAYLETDQLTKAKEIFKKAGTGQGLMAREATWLLAMTYLKEGNKEELRKTLEVLNRDNGLYSKKAKKVLEALKKQN